MSRSASKRSSRASAPRRRCSPLPVPRRMTMKLSPMPTTTRRGTMMKGAIQRLVTMPETTRRVLQRRVWQGTAFIGCYHVVSSVTSYPDQPGTGNSMGMYRKLAIVKTTLPGANVTVIRHTKKQMVIAVWDHLKFYKHHGEFWETFDCAVAWMHRMWVIGGNYPLSPKWWDDYTELRKELEHVSSYRTYIVERPDDARSGGCLRGELYNFAVSLRPREDGVVPRAVVLHSAEGASRALGK